MRGGLLHELEPAPGDGIPVDSVTLLPPIGDPGKIVCIGLNYRSHAAEAGIDAPERPTFFGKFANALAAAGRDGGAAAGQREGRLRGRDRGGRSARAAAASAPDAALDHVAGYMLFNDLSARDWQFATPQWMPGKVFDGSAPCGPALVTQDEAGAHDAIEFKLELNGEVMQDASTADLIHSVPELVAHLSELMTLEPGDIIATGTPSGVGSVRDPQVWLKAGDEIVISSPTLGELRTTIG